MYTADDVTVVISTKDRTSDLRETLFSLSQLDPSPKSVFIADNSLVGSVSEILVDLTAELNVVVFHQPIPGQSRSLNFLLKHVTSKVCLFTDDDVRVMPDWISRMLDCLNTTGAIAVQGEIHIPELYTKSGLSLEERLALFEIKDLADQYKSSPFLIGANFALAWHRCNDLKFDENTGPGALGYMGDTLLCLDLMERNEKLAYCDCPVIHFFPRDRILKPTPLLDGIKHGRSTAYVEHKKGCRVRNGIVFYCCFRFIRMMWFMCAYLRKPKKYLSTYRTSAITFFHYWFRIKYLLYPGPLFETTTRSN